MSDEGRRAVSRKYRQTTALISLHEQARRFLMRIGAVPQNYTQTGNTLLNLASLLADGSVLCKLLQWIHPPIVPRYNVPTTGPLNSFQRIENISIFMKGCSALGLITGFTNDNVLSENNTHRIVDFILWIADIVEEVENSPSLADTGVSHTEGFFRGRNPYIFKLMREAVNREKQSSMKQEDPSIPTKDEVIFDPDTNTENSENESEENTSMESDLEDDNNDLDNEDDDEDFSFETDNKRNNPTQENGEYGFESGFDLNDLKSVNNNILNSKANDEENINNEDENSDNENNTKNNNNDNSKEEISRLSAGFANKTSTFQSNGSQGKGRVPSQRSPQEKRNEWATSRGKGNLETSVKIASGSVETPKTNGRETPSDTILSPLPVLELDNVQSQEERLRISVIYEITKSERDYVRDMELLVKGFMDPLQSNNIISEEELLDIFSNILFVLPVNHRLLSMLEQRITKNPKQDWVIGDIFVGISSKFKVYTRYCIDQEKAFMVIDHVRKQNPAFETFLKQTEYTSRVNYISLIGFLNKPIQRILKYSFLISELLRFTLQTSPDYKILIEAQTCMDSITRIVNESKRKSENVRKLLEIQNSMSGTDRLVICKPSRIFLRESSFVKISRGRPKRRQFFLFSDMIIYAQPAAAFFKKDASNNKPPTLSRSLSVKNQLTFHVHHSHKGKPFIYKGRINIRRCTIRDIPDYDRNQQSEENRPSENGNEKVDEVVGYKGFKNVFEIIATTSDGKLEKHILSAANPTEKRFWLDEIAKRIESSSRRRTDSKSIPPSKDLLTQPSSASEVSRIPQVPFVHLHVSLTPPGFPIPTMRSHPPTRISTQPSRFFSQFNEKLNTRTITISIPANPINSYTEQTYSPNINSPIEKATTKKSNTITQTPGNSPPSLLLLSHSPSPPLSDSNNNNNNNNNNNEHTLNNNNSTSSTPTQSQSSSPILSTTQFVPAIIPSHTQPTTKNSNQDSTQIIKSSDFISINNSNSNNNSNQFPPLGASLPSNSSSESQGGFTVWKSHTVRGPNTTTKELTQQLSLEKQRADEAVQSRDQAYTEIEKMKGDIESLRKALTNLVEVQQLQSLEGGGKGSLLGRAREIKIPLAEAKKILEKTAR